MLGEREKPTHLHNRDAFGWDEYGMPSTATDVVSANAASKAGGWAVGWTPGPDGHTISYPGDQPTEPTGGGQGPIPASPQPQAAIGAGTIAALVAGVVAIVLASYWGWHHFYGEGVTSSVRAR